MTADIALELMVDSGVLVSSKQINLLKAIQKTKSITKAAQELDMSYKNAWDTINQINLKSKFPLINRINGSKKNSGTQISEYAKNIIKTYELILGVQKKFLDEICVNDGISEQTIKNLERIKMKISARNQLILEVVKIKRGAINSEIIAKFPDGQTLKSIITLESLDNLKLDIGSKVLFIFKASSVIVGKDDGKRLQISAANQIKGKISSAKIGAVNTEVTMDIGNAYIVATITNESAQELKLGVGDDVIAIVKASHILVGV